QNPQLRYQYRLIGYRDEWSEWTGQAFQQYRSLPAGNYVFEVRSRGTDLQEWPAAAVRVTMLPPWYRSRMAWSGYFLVVVLLTSGSIRWANYRARQRLRELQALVDVQTKDLCQARDDLEQRVEVRTTQLRRTNQQLLTEIEQHRVTAQKLNEREQQFRSVVEDQTEMVIRFRQDGLLTFANRAFRELHHLNESDVDRFNCFTVIHPDDRERVIQKIQNLSPHQPFETDVIRVTRSDGTKDRAVWHGRAIFDADGRHCGYQAVGRIVTELFEAQQRLQESELRYRSVVEDQKEMIVRFGIDGRITFSNQAFARSYACSPEEVVGMSCYTGIHPDDLPEAKRRIARICYQHPFADMVVRIVKEDGNARWREWNGRGLFDEAGNLLGY
ncbi:MAG: PAS domain S-box protein, partial [Planctomycetaceae bacterium]|nr:PAS domain S-box protein [Planctomycetaceae bacterium]